MGCNLDWYVQKCGRIIEVISIFKVKKAVNWYYYIDTDEIPGFFLLLKNHIFIARSEDTIFISSCEDTGVAMVTSMISQLQESFPLRLLSIIVFISPF